MYCRSLRSITLPAKITEICESTFAECSKPKTVRTTANLKRIEDFAFVNTKKLKSISELSNVTEIGSEAFGGSNIRLPQPRRTPTP